MHRQEILDQVNAAAAAAGKSALITHARQSMHLRCSHLLGSNANIGSLLQAQSA